MTALAGVFDLGRGLVFLCNLFSERNEAEMVSEETVNRMTSIIVEFCERFYGWEASVAKLGKLSAPQLRTI